MNSGGGGRMREGGGAWRWTCGRRRRCLQGGPATWGNGFGRRGAPVQHGSPPPGGLHGLQEGGAGSRGRGRGTARRWLPLGSSRGGRGGSKQLPGGHARSPCSLSPLPPGEGDDWQRPVGPGHCWAGVGRQVSLSLTLFSFLFSDLCFDLIKILNQVIFF